MIAQITKKGKKNQLGENTLTFYYVGKIAVERHFEMKDMCLYDLLVLK